MSALPSPIRTRGTSGSAIVAVLGVVALLTLIAVTLFDSVRIDRIESSSALSSGQARLSAESAVEAARALLLVATSNRPAYLVGLEQPRNGPDTAPALLIGATNLTNGTQILPLLSYDLRKVAQYPRLTKGTAEEILSSRQLSNPASVVDLNDPALQGGSITNGEGFVAPSGRYPAFWQTLFDETGRPVGRYAFVLTDESARLNPALHTGKAGTNPLDWYGGPSDLAITNGGTEEELPGREEAEALHEAATNIPTEEAFGDVLTDPARRECLSLLTRDPCRVPDVIPPGFPEAGLPKYNLNDLATNPVWGSTPYDRATNIAAIIGRNLPKFRERDPSLKGSQQDLYLNRLACSIVDYISGARGPTGPPGGEPCGRDLAPCVTQIGELCTRTSLTPTSTVIESRFFVEVWNPTTSPIPAGSAGLTIGNRARVRFGSDIASAFPDYIRDSVPVPAIAPNEFAVIPFPPVSDCWSSPVATSNPPSWEKGPTGNGEDGHQWFEFRWNGRLGDLSRRPGISPGTDRGGLSHLPQTLSTTNGYWQVWTIPTWGSQDSEEEADQALETGQYRFVGDPRAGFETAYVWSAMTNFLTTRWKGINPASERGNGYVMDPLRTWTARDRVPVDPFPGNRPSSPAMMPDAVPSPYVAGDPSAQAPFVIRKGPMLSLGELGHIFDPAQVDDQGKAPVAKKERSAVCCGGGRTLRIGQPEFRYAGAGNWDVPGKRAVDLIDLFTVADRGREPGSAGRIPGGTNAGIAGRINVNTAPPVVLEDLFRGIEVSSDTRYPGCRISAKASGDLAGLLIAHRPYAKLSDLSLLTTNLTDAETYAPRLGRNVPGSSPPVADVFDRAREEAFGRILGHCVLQSRVFRIHAVGEALDPKGKTTGRALLRGLLRLEPDANGRLVPTLQDVHWQ